MDIPTPTESVVKEKKKRPAKKKSSGKVDPKNHAVHVHVNVVNNAGESSSGKRKPGNDADHMLQSLRGW